MKLLNVLSGNSENLPTDYLWKYGNSQVKVIAFDNMFVIFESKTGNKFKKSRYHCGVHFVEISES